MVIRVSGYPGSGKTTLCRHLAEALGYEYHYAGGIFREMAKEKRMSIEDFYIQLAVDPKVEHEVDDKQKAIMAIRNNLIMEGRVAPFLPCPFKTCNILVTVSAEESARRALMRPENAGRSLEDMEAQTLARVEAEDKHYYALHKIEGHLDPKHFDIVVDTTSMTPDQVFECVMKELATKN